jgi:hypothetical protein
MRLLRATPILLVLLAACGSAEVKNVQSQGDLFLSRLAKGDFNGAFELCDPDAVSHDALRAIRNNAEYDEVFDDYRGLRFSEGANATRNDDREIVEIRLAPAEFKGHKGWYAHFAFRRQAGKWWIIAFKIERPQA